MRKGSNNYIRIVSTELLIGTLLILPAPIPVHAHMSAEAPTHLSPRLAVPDLLPALTVAGGMSAPAEFGDAATVPSAVTLKISHSLAVLAETSNLSDAVDPVIQVLNDRSFSVNQPLTNDLAFHTPDKLNSVVMLDTEAQRIIAANTALRDELQRIAQTVSVNIPGSLHLYVFQSRVVTESGLGTLLATRNDGSKVLMITGRSDKREIFASMGAELGVASSEMGFEISAYGGIGTYMTTLLTYLSEYFKKIIQVGWDDNGAKLQGTEVAHAELKQRQTGMEYPTLTALVHWGVNKTKVKGFKTVTQGYSLSKQMVAFMQEHYPSVLAVYINSWYNSGAVPLWQQMFPQAALLDMFHSIEPGKYFKGPDLVDGFLRMKGNVGAGLGQMFANRFESQLAGLNKIAMSQGNAAEPLQFYEEGSVRINSNHFRWLMTEMVRDQIVDRALENNPVPIMNILASFREPQEVLSVLETIFKKTYLYYGYSDALAQSKAGNDRAGVEELVKDFLRNTDQPTRETVEQLITASLRDTVASTIVRESSKLLPEQEAKLYVMMENNGYVRYEATTKTWRLTDKTETLLRQYQQWWNVQVQPVLQENGYMDQYGMPLEKSGDDYAGFVSLIEQIMQQVAPPQFQVSAEFVGYEQQMMQLLNYPRTKNMASNSRIITHSIPGDPQDIPVPNKPRAIALLKKLLENHIASNPDGQQAVLSAKLDEVLRGERKVLFYAGRLSGQKGFEVLVPALKQLGTEGYMVVMLATPDAKDMERLAQAEIVPNDNVLWINEFIKHSRVDEKTGQKVVSLLRTLADVILVPSINEPGGLVVLEGFQAGVPVVALKGSGGPEDFIRDFRTVGLENANGIIADAQTPEALAEAIQSLLALSAEEMNILKESTIRSFMESFRMREATALRTAKYVLSLIQEKQVALFNERRRELAQINPGAEIRSVVVDSAEFQELFGQAPEGQQLSYIQAVLLARGIESVEVQGTAAAAGIPVVGTVTEPVSAVAAVGSAI